MNELNLTVIAGGNPDDSFAQSNPNHLTVVDLVPTPAATTVTVFPRPAPLRIVDAMIGLLMRLRERIERADQARPQPDHHQDTPSIGRGW